MLYRFETKISDSDYYEFNKYQAMYSPHNKISWHLGELCVPAMLLFEFIHYIIIGADLYFLSFAFIYICIVSVIWIFSVKPLFLFFLKLYVGFMKMNGKILYSDFATLEFYDHYFIELTENTRTEVQYNGVFKVRINQQKAIYIYQNAVLAYIIPFDVFDSNEERNKFIDFISQKTNK